MTEKQILSFKPHRDLNRPATNIPSAYRIANIALNDAMFCHTMRIQAGWNFRKGQVCVVAILGQLPPPGNMHHMD
jgi:hypothetical protein